MLGGLTVTAGSDTLSHFRDGGDRGPLCAGGGSCCGVGRAPAGGCQRREGFRVGVQAQRKPHCTGKARLQQVSKLMWRNGVLRTCPKRKGPSSRMPANVLRQVQSVTTCTSRLGPAQIYLARSTAWVFIGAPTKGSDNPLLELRHCHACICCDLHHPGGSLLGSARHIQSPGCRLGR